MTSSTMGTVYEDLSDVYGDDTTVNNDEASIDNIASIVDDEEIVDNTEFVLPEVIEDEHVPSGTNVSTDRNFTVQAAVPEVLYQLEWFDRGSRKPSFYSSTPFTNLTISKDTVSKQYQAPGRGAQNGDSGKTVQPIIEVVTKMVGTAQRDKIARGPPNYREEYYPPPPPPQPHQPNRPYRRAETFSNPPPPLPRGLHPEQGDPQVVKEPYKLEEIAIERFEATRVLIHSELLLKALRSVITYYPLQRLTDFRATVSISAPYMALVHHREELVDFSRNGNSQFKPCNMNLQKGADDSGVKKEKVDVKKMMEHMRVLLDFSEPYYHKFMNRAEDRLWKISPIARHDELWYLFPPGIDVYFETEGKIVAGVVIGSRFDPDDELEIKVWYLVFDGTNLKRRAVTVYIDTYTGEREVVALDVCPAKIWDIKDGGKRRKAFETRGEQVFRLCKGRHKQIYYNGLDEEGEQFKGLVIIDNDPIKNLDFHDNTDDASSRSGSSRGSRRSRSPPVQTTLNRRLAPGDDPDDDISSSSSGTGVLLVRPNLDKDEEEEEKKPDFRWAKYNNLTIDSPDVTKHHYMLFNPFIVGFAVLVKKWKSFDIDYISEVPKRDDMIDNVVMESAKQQIIKAISHPQNHTWKLDFIQGKGEGQIVLLHGPPGVGKTYTVGKHYMMNLLPRRSSQLTPRECAAEATGRPLIFLTIADIGLDEKRIEDQMTKWFSLAERWEAILLIDEADIFLERRRGADIARNGLVSVFLRKMEYFQGLLFLTTNRIGQIDDAFLSRIHVVIGYTPLDEAKRKLIWNGFFKKLEHDMKIVASKAVPAPPPTTKPSSSSTPSAPPPTQTVQIRVSKYAKEYVLNDEEVRELRWNGREIRNAFQTAISLAGFEASKEEGWGEGGRERVVDVQKDHFVSVVKMSREFHSYMDSITLQEEGERARGRLERNDGFGG